MKKMNNCESLVPFKQLGIRTLKFLRISVLLLLVTFVANYATAKESKSTGSTMNQVQTEQQKRIIKGKVTDETGEAIPGVSVLVKGTNVGTITNIDGVYSIDVPATGKSLVFSFVGMTTQEIALDSRSEVNVSLKSTTIGVDEVVVTALGIQREKKTLTYSSQQVSGAEMLKARDANFMNALSGKTSGLDIKVSSSGAGGSTKVVLRGNKSLTGLSEPLYVIDGIPMINNKGSQPGSYGGTDGGDGLTALNSDDIESINVLKGANASILYGSEGANGVVLITTKKGKAGKVDVNVSSSTMLDAVSTLPKFQYKYGADKGSDYSWSYTPGNYQSGYIKDYFRTGVNTTNSISISGGNDKTTTYFSYSNVSASGVMPTNKYNKHNFSFNQSSKVFNKVTVSSNVMLTYEESHNRPGAGYYNNPLTGLYLFARERNFADYKANYQVFNKERNFNVMNWYSTEEKQNNPYWEIYNDPKLNTSFRAIASLKLSWDIVDHLKFDVRGNVDYNNRLNDYRYAAGGNSVSVSPNGSWNYSKYNDRAFYTDAILNYNNNFGDISFTGLLGAVYAHTILNDGMSVSNGTVSLMYPNFFSFANMPYNVMFNQSIDKRIKEGVFGNFQIGYRDMLYLDLSGRNDWASTLALTGNESYFYPAVGLTAIVNQMVHLPDAISFAKVRVSSSQTGNEVPFNRVNPWNSIGGAGTPSAIGGINRNTQVPFTNMKPEKITSNEVGAEMRFFKGRAGFEFTYYSDISKNQFLSLAAPSGSGYTTYFVNAGKITNKGFELTVDAEPVKTKNVDWKTSVNLSQNRNKIVELIADNPNYQVGGDDEGFASVIKAGGSFNDIYIYKFARNAAGQIILDEKDGKPTKAATQEKVGNVNPDFILGWNNTIGYKKFFCSILVNGKFGGKAFSKTEAFLDSYGVSQRTADARDNANHTIPINAIKGTTAVTSIDAKTYYDAVGDRNRIMEPYIFSRTNIRLAQIVLGYNLDVQKLKLPIKDASISLIGRNLFFFYKKAPYDPENTMSTSNSMQSNEVFSMPATRTYGINLKLTF